MFVPYISASRLKTAQECLLKYHLHYEQPNADAQALKEIGNHRDNSQAGRMGNNVHDALEEWRRPDPETGKTPKPSFGRLMTLYKEVNAKREVDFDFYEDGKKMLKRWFDRRGRDPVRVLHVEMPFGRHDAPYVLSRTGTPVLGFIDLIIEHKDGTIECIDYKTQRLDITQAEADNSIQAAIYLCVAREIWPDRPIQFTFDLQRHGTVTTVWTDERLETFKDWLHSQYEHILSVDSTDTSKVPATIGKGCQWCAYTPICSKAQDLMQNGAWDMLTPTLGADLNDLLNELATIKASKCLTSARRLSTPISRRRSLTAPCLLRNAKPRQRIGQSNGESKLDAPTFLPKCNASSHRPCLERWYRCRMRQSIGCYLFSPMTLLTLSNEHRLPNPKECSS